DGLGAGGDEPVRRQPLRIVAGTGLGRCTRADRVRAAGKPLRARPAAAQPNLKRLISMDLAMNDLTNAVPMQRINVPSSAQELLTPAPVKLAARGLDFYYDKYHALK